MKYILATLTLGLTLTTGAIAAPSSPQPQISDSMMKGHMMTKGHMMKHHTMSGHAMKGHSMQGHSMKADHMTPATAKP